MALGMVENGTVPFAWLVGVCLLWAVTTFYGHRLLRHFVAKYPKAAAKELPYAFSHFAHPEKAIYFLRRRSRDFLVNDPELFKERRRFVYLSVLSIIAPFGGFAALVVYALLHK